MIKLVNLTDGLEIIEPFLGKHGFKFEGYEYINKKDGLLTQASYHNAGKKIIIGFGYSVQQIIYQYNNLELSHFFYMDKLGFADIKRFPDFQFDDKHLSFKNILLDFKYLEDDFFMGSCAQLTQFANLHDELIKAQEKFEYKYEAFKVEQARKEFRKKEYDNCMELYQSIEHKELLNDLDNKIVEFCAKNIKHMKIK